jgi:thioredoxin-dependent peroxiredoxin
MTKRLGIFAFALLVAGVALFAACGAVQRPDGGKGLLQPGALAPQLEGLDQKGRTRKLSEFRGRYSLLFFYPKDGTPGCTKEACAIRDAWKQYQRQEVAVLGISSDDVASHADFVKEQRLPFDAIADEQGKWARAFGVRARLGFYERVSFLLAPDGKVAATFANVDPGVHASEVLETVERLRAKK